MLPQLARDMIEQACVYLRADQKHLGLGVLDKLMFLDVLYHRLNALEGKQYAEFLTTEEAQELADVRARITAHTPNDGGTVTCASGIFKDETKPAVTLVSVRTVE